MRCNSLIWNYKLLLIKLGIYGAIDLVYFSHGEMNIEMLSNFF